MPPGAPVLPPHLAQLDGIAALLPDVVIIDPWPVTGPPATGVTLCK
jgi:hypothetical protein